MRKFLFRISIILGVLWLINSSWLYGPSPKAVTTVLAHRGVHQTFDVSKTENDSCTAEMIGPPTHGYLENTIPSMQAAFTAGAGIVELDVHLTPDGKFAVFHDWTVDCRTQGTGVTHDIPMGKLKTLDIGYGYTADGGKTYPFRGKGIGLMPELEEVFEALPDGRFLINFKSERVEEGEALVRMLKANPKYRAQVFGVYGGGISTQTVIAALVGMRGFAGAVVKGCLKRYAALGWSGYVPTMCRDTVIAVPIDYAPFLWGWPHRFTGRMKEVGTRVILLGPYAGGHSAGVDTPKLASKVPAGFDGIVWTNKIEAISPAMIGK